MLMTYRPPGDRSQRLFGRSALLFAGGFALLSALAILWPAIDPGIATAYERTIAFQAGRNSPFSIWGQVPSLEWLRTLVLVATAGLSIALAFYPRRKSLVQVAALGAALIIALQITMHHWFYLYIDWFYPLLLVALAAVPKASPAKPRTTEEPEPSPAQTSQPVPAG
jgi:hypothetical protein